MPSTVESIVVVQCEDKSFSLQLHREFLSQRRETLLREIAEIDELAAHLAALEAAALPPGQTARVDGTD